MLRQLKLKLNHIDGGGPTLSGVVSTNFQTVMLSRFAFKDSKLQYNICNQERAPKHKPIGGRHQWAKHRGAPEAIKKAGSLWRWNRKARVVTQPLSKPLGSAASGLHAHIGGGGPSRSALSILVGPSLPGPTSIYQK